VLTTYRRHEGDCRFTSRDEKKCRCPIWIDLAIDGKRKRRSLKTRDWQVAAQRAREIEANAGTEIAFAPSVEDACKSYLTDVQRRGLKEATVQKYGVLLRQLQEFSKAHGLVFISDLNLDRTRSFVESWKNKGQSAKKKLELLRTFFSFCLDSGWIKENYAKKIKPAKVEPVPVLPFSDDEVNSILSATKKYPNKANAVRLRALVLLLRYSGLRIMDAATLDMEKIKSGKLMLRTAKTGTVVNIPLPPVVLKALKQVPDQKYPFWTGESKPKSAAFVWQRTLGKLFKLAGIEGGHAHRFRHTFAVNLLLRGVSIETVAQLLGHETPKTTLKHYAPWVKERQLEMEKAVKATW